MAVIAGLLQTLFFKGAQPRATVRTEEEIAVGHLAFPSPVTALGSSHHTRPMQSLSAFLTHTLDAAGGPPGLPLGV